MINVRMESGSCYIQYNGIVLLRQHLNSVNLTRQFFKTDCIHTFVFRCRENHGILLTVQPGIQ